MRRAPAGPDEVRWNPDSGEFDPAALDGVDAVVNMCGVGVGDKRWSGAYKQQLRDSRIDPTEVISAAVANRLPGPGTIYLGQQMRFKAPVRPGDTVHATVTVMSVDRAKARAVLATVCRVRDTVVIEGEAQVMTTSRARREAKAASAEASGTPAAGAAVAAP